MAAQQPSGTEAKEDAVVEYTGTSDVRKISAAEWKAAGVEDQNQVVWDRSNRKKVGVAELNKDALDVLRQDSGFKVPRA